LNASDHLVTLAPPDTQGLTAGVETAARAVGLPLTPIEEAAALPSPLEQIPLTVRLQLLALRYALERGQNPDVAIEGPWDDPGLWAIGSPGSLRPHSPHTARAAIRRSVAAVPPP